MSPWEISDTYSGLQMSAIIVNTPKIKSLGIRFLRIALKSQHSLTGVVLQNTQEIYLLNPEQGGTWDILNETSWMKNIQILQDLKEWAGEFLGWLQSLFGGSFSRQGWIWSWLISLLIPVITILMLLVIAPCIINCLTCFCLCPGQQTTLCSASSTRIYKATTWPMENITHL